MRMFIEEKASLLRDAVFSASDGIVTTFAVVAGAAGASLSTRVILIMGFANLFADGISMASGNYLGVKSELEYERSKKDRSDRQASPLVQGIATFISFNLAGFVSLSPYVFGFKNPFACSVVMVGIALFTVGVIRGRFIKKSWIISGLELFLIGGFAALVAYSTGEILKKIIG